MAIAEKLARTGVIEAGRKLLEKQLVARTWGNISARIDDSHFVITPSGRAYENLHEDDLVLVATEDCSYSGDIKPSSEKGVHAAAYRLRPEADFIIHTHQFFASALSAAGKDIPFAPCAAYGLPGTKKLVNNVSVVIKKNPGSNSFLMARHGALCLGNDMDSAFEEANRLEQESEKQFFSRVKLPDCGLIEDPSSIIKAFFPFVKHEGSPFAVTCSLRGRALRPYLDDYAQMIGPTARCCEAKPILIERALGNRHGVLLIGKGALCVAGEADDAEAAAQIMRKNCAAALYVNFEHPLSAPDALLQRLVYLKKYSRQKDA